MPNSILPQDQNGQKVYNAISSFFDRISFQIPYKILNCVRAGGTVCQKTHLIFQSENVRRKERYFY